ncbi:MAG: AAA family ATPase [Candidatus Moranbacteria bacterium]|nr:AAA family ATPase [Candidatus Moranbacteria bacterium]
MNQYFIFWYYTRGLRGAVLLLGNYLRFVVHRFYMGGLLRTFFSPWKRDVIFHTWGGFHPIRSLEAMFQNLLTRLLGMFLRLMLFIIGVSVWCITLVLGVAFFFFYIGAPFFIVFGFIVLPLSPSFGIASLFIGVISLGSAFFGYVMRKKEEPLTFDIEKLRKKKFFKRVLARLGLEKKSVEKEALKDTKTFLTFLKTLGIEEVLYERAVIVERATAEKKAQKSRFWSWENLHTQRPFGKDWHYAYTPRLDHYCLELSRFDPTEYGRAELIGRHDELRVVTVVLARETQNNVILVGDPGIGKKTFIHHLARLIRENRFGAEYLDGARVLLFDIGRAVSDAASQGIAADHYLRRLFVEATYAGNVILAVENVDLYLGNEHSLPNLAVLFSEFLQLPNFRLIATAPTGRYHALAKEDEQTLKFFEVIYLRETTKEETLSILIQHFERAERRRIAFTLRGFDAIIESAGRYNWEMPFPERAIDLAQEVLVYWSKSRKGFITQETVDAFTTLKTGVPTGALGAGEKEKLLKLEELLHLRVIGQNEAVKQVAEAMRKARAGFGDDKRPLGSFIFFGPSGVGKTETVKAFAESYFGSEERMIRLDMSEFQTSESIDRLIGSRAMGIQGQLVEAAREKPFSILLLDEIEKAYPRALDLFLQILDEGYVTDGYGEKVSFRNMVIIATSNAGAPLIKVLVREKASMAVIRERVLDHIIENNLFRLEFLSRFDGIIFFEPLKQGELEAVAKLKLKKFADRLKKEKNITISFTPDVVPKIVEKGFEPEFGTRSLNRFIENAIEDAVVKKIIAGEVKEGGALVVSGDEL